MEKKLIYCLSLFPKKVFPEKIIGSHIELYNGQEYYVLEKRPKNFQNFLREYYIDESELIKKLIEYTKQNPKLKVEGIIYDNHSIKIL